MKLSKVVYQMMTQLETLAACAIRDNLLSMSDQSLLNGFTYILTESIRSSFYPDYDLVALKLEDYKNVIVIGQCNSSDMELDREVTYELFDNAVIPLQDLYHLLDELDRANPAKQDTEDDEEDGRDEDELEGGQDRKSYSDDQDRKNYPSNDEEIAPGFSLT